MKRQDKGYFGFISIAIIMFGVGYLLYQDVNPPDASTTDTYEEPVEIKETGILIEVYDKDGNVIDSNRYAKPDSTLSVFAQNVWGVPESDIKYLTKELKVNIHGCCVGGTCSTNIDYSGKPCLDSTGYTCTSRQECSSGNFVPAAAIGINFTVKNIGELPLQVEFTEGIIEGSYFD